MWSTSPVGGAAGYAAALPRGSPTANMPAYFPSLSLVGTSVPLGTSVLEWTDFVFDFDLDSLGEVDLLAGDRDLCGDRCGDSVSHALKRRSSALARCFGRAASGRAASASAGSSSSSSSASPPPWGGAAEAWPFIALPFSSASCGVFQVTLTFQVPDSRAQVLKPSVFTFDTKWGIMPSSSSAKPTGSPCVKGSDAPRLA
mmetsp:Transcript_121952/g.352264  ORF Transcript_121952/g.352264 Transcript_121952/m.352264 type:complete len:200 (-) Transcript_121952:356-955(-)